MSTSKLSIPVIDHTFPDVSFLVDGVIYRLRFDFDAIAIFQHGTGINLVPEFAAIADDENYSRWCRATPNSVRGYGGDGKYGIREVGTPEFLAACREAEAKIEAVGGIEYAALVA